MTTSYPGGAPETYVFDRLGENTNPPICVVADLDDAPRALRRHALEHVISSDGYYVHDISVRRRRLGGYDIVDTATSYTYGVARRMPVFVEKEEPPAFAVPAWAKA